MQEVRKLGNAFIYFSDRNDGVSTKPYDSLNIGAHVGDDVEAVSKNREVLHSLINEQQPITDSRNWIFLNQTHESNIFLPEEQTYNQSTPPIADAAITQKKDQPLVVMTADCGPLVIAGESTLAVVHASYKTVALGLVKNTIEEMKRRSANEKFSSFLGPCIYPHTYEFDPQLLKEIVKKLGSHIVGNTREGKPAFDLPQAIRFECENQGVEFDEIGINTYDSSNHFSYRHDGITGRQGVVAWLA